MLDIDMKRVVEPGMFEIMVGTDSSRTTETLLQVEEPLLRNDEYGNTAGDL
jgi:hypothetical protein